MIVSRHFSLLAGHYPVHQRFLQAEKARQQRLDSSGNADDLARWTAALGFCDLVSLFLLSGLSREVELPLAHPASPEAQTAPRVRMQVRGRKLRFTPGVTRAGCVLSIQALKHPVPKQGPRAETLTWEVE
jgi:predicted exporter